MTIFDTARPIPALQHPSSPAHGPDDHPDQRPGDADAALGRAAASATDTPAGKP